MSMKRTFVLVAVLALVMGWASHAHAFGLFLGWWDAEDLNSGWGIGVKKPVGIAIVRVVPQVSWFRFGDADVNMFPLEVVGELDLGIAYGGLGVGYYILNRDIKNRLGWFLVGGAKAELGGTGVFGEIRYNDLDNTALSLDGFSINVGISLGV